MRIISRINANGKEIGDITAKQREIFLSLLINRIDFHSQTKGKKKWKRGKALKNEINLIIPVDMDFDVSLEKTRETRGS